MHLLITLLRHLRNQQRALVVAIVFALGLTACGLIGPQRNEAIDLPPSEAVNIRIRNDTGDAIDRVRLGLNLFDNTGTFETIYVDIPNDGQSDYLPIDPSSGANYSEADLSANSVSDSREIQLGLEESLGVSELELGYYTLVFGVENGRFALLDFTVDESPAAN